MVATLPALLFWTFLSVQPASAVFTAFDGRLSVYGDGRIRLENDSNRDSQRSRTRERLRFRLGADVSLNEEFGIHTRLATGTQTDQQSPHQTLGNNLEKQAVNFDRIYVSWKPEWVKGGWIRGGKFAHPFKAPAIYSELVWDADVQPEGIAIGWDKSAFGNQDLSFTGGWYALSEQNTGDDASVGVGQIALAQKLNNKTDLLIAVGYYGYQQFGGGALTALLADNVGNNTNAAGTDYVSDFGIWDAFVNVNVGRYARPVVFTFQAFKNARARVPEDKGYAIGAACGKAKARGDRRYYVQYQRVLRDAVFSPFVHDDFLIQTNFKGGVGGIQWMLFDNTELHLWALTSHRLQVGTTATTDGRQSQLRLRMDLNVKF